jgi:hypothetical protein
VEAGVRAVVEEALEASLADRVLLGLAEEQESGGVCVADAEEALSEAPRPGMVGSCASCTRDISSCCFFIFDNLHDMLFICVQGFSSG